LASGREEVGSAEDVRHAVLRVVENDRQLVAGFEAPVGRHAGEHEVATFFMEMERPLRRARDRRS
jgi:hypothetical protein